MNLTNIRGVKELLNKYNTVTKKSFGQNFLISPSIPVKIAAASLNATTTETEANNEAGVIEIGAGVGTLSQELCKLYKKVVAVELDRTLEPILNEVFENTHNFKVIFADILKTDIKSLTESEFNGYKQINICANLPYYITTPTITYLLESGVKFNTITVMIQKEVASRLCAEAGSEDYGSITLFVNYYGEIKKLFNVPPSNFYPPPKVTSSVIQILPYERPRATPEDEKLMFKVIRAAFEQRRKTLVNALASAFGDIDKSRIAGIVEEITGNANIRGEMLNLEKFAAISNIISRENQNKL